MGEDKKEYMVHADLVANLSPALNSLINSKFSGAREGMAEWSHIDERTFVAITQFAYTGEYTATGAQPVEERSPNKVRCHSCYFYICKCNVPHRVRSIYDSIESRYEYGDVGRLWVKLIEECGITDATTPLLQTNTEPTESWEDNFLLHARIYVLADQYGIEELVKVSSRRLARTLIAFRPFKERIQDIIALIRYTLENTFDKNGVDDTLRSIVYIFTACKLEALWQDDHFRKLYRAMPDFLNGTMVYMLKRME